MKNFKESKKPGKLFVLSAPSGAGKTTLCKEMLERFSQLSFSVSHTTRAPRKGEVHGRDYFFIDRQSFESGIERALWVEWALVHGNYYGTSRSFVNSTLEKGGSLILDIDVQGAKQIVAAFPGAVTVFIMAPDLVTLERRLRGRGTDSEEVIRQRLENAEQEIMQRDWYTHVIVNDDLAISIETLKAIFEGELA
ncbi:MAG: guanylate kinase [Desulfobacterium sp.]|nr:guanylate kinase [Desulfobacterium sp.]